MNLTELLHLMMGGKDVMTIAQESGLGAAHISHMMRHLESLGYIERIGPECGTACIPCPHSTGRTCGSIKGAYFRITEKGIRRLKSQGIRT